MTTSMATAGSRAVGWARPAPVSPALCLTYFSTVTLREALFLFFMMNDVLVIHSFVILEQGLRGEVGFIAPVFN